MKIYLPFHVESIETARQLCAGMDDDFLKYKAVTNYVSTHFAYDYVKAITIPKRGGLPDVENCWNKRIGICGDLSAMTVGMLRGVGLKAWLVIGRADKICHAWVETDWGIYDPTVAITKRKVKTYKKERMY